MANMTTLRMGRPSVAAALLAGKPAAAAVRMGTTAYAQTRGSRRGMVVLVATMALGLFGVLLLLASGPAQAHDHQIPQTVLMKGTKELQAGTRVKESSWDRPAGEDLCETRRRIYGTRFPETDSVAAGAKLRVRISNT